MNQFYADYALKLHQNSGIMHNSFAPSLSSKLFRHISRIPTLRIHWNAVEWSTLIILLHNDEGNAEVCACKVAAAIFRL